MSDNEFKPPLNLTQEQLKGIKEIVGDLNQTNHPFQYYEVPAVPINDKSPKEIIIKNPPKTGFEGLYERHIGKITIILFIIAFVEAIALAFKS